MSSAARGRARPLWPGCAFESVDDVAAVLPVSTRNPDELRTAGTEDLGEALLGMHRYEEAILLLEPLLITAPYRERPVAVLMRALAAAGRVTKHCGSSSGSGSSCATRSARHRRHRCATWKAQLIAGVGLGGADRSSPEPTATPPRKLPVRPTSLIGRDEEVARVRDVLAASAASR